MENSKLFITGKIVSAKLAGKAPLKPSSASEQIVVTDVKLPKDAPARMRVLKAEGKKWYVTVVYLPDSEKPYALFCTTNQREGTPQTDKAVESLLELARSSGILPEHIDVLEKKLHKAGTTNVDRLTRSLSLLLRHNVGIVKIVQCLDSLEDVYVGSFLFQIKKLLSSYIEEGVKVEGQVCGECGSANLIYSEGCMSCADCGSSKCG